MKPVLKQERYHAWQCFKRTDIWDKIQFLSDSLIELWKGMFEYAGGGEGERCVITEACEFNVPHIPVLPWGN